MAAEPASQPERDEFTGICAGSTKKYTPRKFVWEWEEKWQKERQRQFFSAKTAGMSRPSGWGSAQGAGNGIPLWKRR